MNRALAILILFLTGCSSMPMADLMDRLQPGQLPAGPYRGGVCSCPAPTMPPATAFSSPPEGEVVASAPAPVGATAPALTPAPDPTAKASTPPSWRRP